MMRKSVFVLFATVAFLVTRGIYAQGSPCLQQVMDLNKKAMDSFAALEIDTAKVTIDQAVKLCQNPQCGIPAQWQAKTYMNLGIILVGGYQDTNEGLNAFAKALQWNPNLQLDVMYSSPLPLPLPLLHQHPRQHQLRIQPQHPRQHRLHIQLQRLRQFLQLMK